MQNANRHLSEISLREHFALECFSAMLANSYHRTSLPMAKLATEAVRHADALLEELSA